jgi:hypothetical protein
MNKQKSECRLVGINPKSSWIIYLFPQTIGESKGVGGRWLLQFWKDVVSSEYEHCAV